MPQDIDPRKPVVTRLIASIWSRPILFVAPLAGAGVWLTTRIIAQSLKSYTNCDYLLVTKLGLNSFFCDGRDVKAFGSTVFSLPGLKGVINPPLESVRTLVACAAIAFLAMASIYLTIVLNNAKSLLKILLLNKEEWHRLLANVRTCLFFFVALAVSFYLSVAR